MQDSNGGRSKGGHARAEALTGEERAAIARQAARARWDADVPRATHEGALHVGNSRFSAAVLANGKRLITQATFLKALGRARSPKKGTGVLTTAEAGVPFFLQAEALQPFISDKVREATTPIFFLDKSARKSVGYSAELLPMVAEVYLQMRDNFQAQGLTVPRKYEHIVRACDALLRGLAQVGIVALVDEATGYQEVRDRQALQAILDQFLRKELAAWAKTFPDDFYKEIFRLRGWEWRGMHVNRPQVVAKYTTNVVYERLAPGILHELEKKNPRDEKGRRKARHHQWLTGDVGHPALAQHLYGVIGIMRLADSWQQFMKMLDRAYPRRGDTLQLPLMTDIPNAFPSAETEELRR